MIEPTFAMMAAGAAAALSVGLAIPAVADDEYWVAVCTGNEIPMNAACRTGGPQGTPTSTSVTDGTARFVGGSADDLPAESPGANPLGVGN